MTPSRQSLKTKLGKLKIPEMVDYCGLRYLKENASTCSVRDERQDQNSSEESSGVMVEVLVKGQFAYASAPALELSVLQSCLDQAVVQAESASQYTLFKFDPTARPQCIGHYDHGSLGKHHTHRPSLTLREHFDILTELCIDLKHSDQVVRTQATSNLVQTKSVMVSTLGSELEQDFEFLYTDFSAIAHLNGITQRRSFGDALQTGLDYFTGQRLSSLKVHAERVGKQAVELLQAQECPNRRSDLIIMPDQMVLQIHESIGHPLELDRILGDERNYAGWSFVWPHDFGKLQYGSSLLNVTFDPTVSGEFASYAYDDGGAKAERRYLIKDGTLLVGLGGIESQLRSQLQGVACSRASSWNRPPVDRMANLNIEPGTSTLEQMISGVEDGVVMESNRSWSIDDYRNKFQFGCEFAREIKDGVLGRVLKNPNYRGISNSFWKSLKRVGCEKTLVSGGSPYCGKAEPNQLIRVGHRSPACLFENVEIFGGGAS